ncbi:hypothetical protein [Heyndrickxia oleronia]|jgi:3-deoxy-D-manno-octulosonic-acid transferase|uniref:hypothetical protein n=1 Tax=Heyndrickxia oleronia TaxID=38875 RepID=UPI00242C936F|nr:hypothetical protein [Heyndrickxia oleronia]MCI1590387.1 hypothetical protein [Heyndrickxia oleronia]MCI1611351.1 hypothetical protein [Heyndrickxia oleronia]MCI1742794.1 hypothetical protein [Heyndrickxia oleronia]MCI1763121.1 hypothetical protein [Heyndrickxia oleronia]
MENNIQNQNELLQELKEIKELQVEQLKVLKNIENHLIPTRDYSQTQQKKLLETLKKIADKLDNTYSNY